MEQVLSDAGFNRLMSEVRRKNWNFVKRQNNAQDIEVEYVPTEECLHVTNYPESVLVRTTGSYDNPQEEFEILPVCTACGEVL